MAGQELPLAERFGFGQNWQQFLKGSFSEERTEIARRHLLAFLKLDRLDGLSFLDIGSGSGLHSLAAFLSGAARIVSFDFDPNSVAATRALWHAAGEPAHWTVRQGSVLDPEFCESLGRFDIVYAWGCLHHTGDQWTAFRHAAERTLPTGRFYVALYCSTAFLDPSPDEWLAIKKRYNRCGPVRRRLMEAAHIWASYCHRDWRLLLKLPQIARNYKASRGMEMMADVRDWLGGWPMEFSSLPDVTSAAAGLGLVLVGLASGEANFEYLFTFETNVAALGLPPIHADTCLTLPLLRNVREIAEDRDFYVFGTAQGARLLLTALRKTRGLGRFAGFIDLEQSGTLDGVPILSFDRFVASASKDSVVILSNSYVTENADRLKDHGFHAIQNGHPLVQKLNARR